MTATPRCFAFFAAKSGSAQTKTPCRRPVRGTNKFGRQSQTRAAAIRGLSSPHGVCAEKIRGLLAHAALIMHPRDPRRLVVQPVRASRAPRTPAHSDGIDPADGGRK